MSVPLKKGKHNQRPIREVEIYEPKIWPKKHWQAIRSCYGRFPYYEHYADGIRDILFENHRLLYYLNTKLADHLIDILGLDIQITSSKLYQPATDDGIDWRNRITPKSLVNLDTTSGYSAAYISRMSILDLIFSKGPETEVILDQISNMIFVSQ